jgi:hypothetical protein
MPSRRYPLAPFILVAALAVLAHIEVPETAIGQTIPPSTPTVTPTRAPEPGGRSLTLTSLGGSRVALRWRGGEQSAFAVVELTNTARVHLLRGSDTSFTASVPASAVVACYMVHALGESASSLANSDGLCVLPRLGFGSPLFGSIPAEFSLSLNESNTATLTWGRARGHLAYVLVALSPTRSRLLPAEATRATDDTGGRLTCYALLSVNQQGPIGMPDVLCAVPGLASFPGAARPTATPPAVPAPSSTPSPAPTRPAATSTSAATPTNTTGAAATSTLTPCPTDDGDDNGQCPTRTPRPTRPPTPTNTMVLTPTGTLTPTPTKTPAPA